MLLIWTYFVLLASTALIMSGARADSLRNICPQEEVKLRCPPLDSVITSQNYEELYWSVTDPDDESSKTFLGHCSNLDQCTRYKSLGIFENRIEIKSHVQGVLVVNQLWKNDLLIFTCNVQRKRKKQPLFFHINVSSSVDCVKLHAGQDFNLSQASPGTISRESIEDMWWYDILPDGTKQLIVYCNSTSCKKTCLKCLPRLEVDGMSLILKNVRQADRGLQIQCSIEPDMTSGKAVKTLPRVYTVKIEDVLEFPTDSDRINSSIPSRNPTTTSTARAHGTQSSAASHVLTLSAVLISLLTMLFCQ